MAQARLKFTGISEDRNDYDQDLSQWSSGINVDFEHGVTKKAFGWTETLTNQYNTFPAPYFLLSWSNPATTDWVMCCNQRVFLVSGTDSYKEITRTSSITTTSDCLSTTASSTTVSVNDPSHGASTDDYVVLNQYDVETSGLVEQELNGWHQITKIDNDNYSFEVLTAASATLSGFGGSLGSIGYSDQYTVDAVNWNGGILSSVLVLNNQEDTPQYMYYNEDFLADLPNWPANTVAKVVKPFKNYLFALNTTENSIRYPYRVRWSHSADPGVVPSTWDESDKTKDAGFIEIAQTTGQIIDMATLSDNNIIYKEDSVWSISFVGGYGIFGVQQLFSDDGILAEKCVVEFGGRHFVVGHDDIYIHDGTSKQSIVEDQMRTYFFDNVNADVYEQVYCVKHDEKKQIWVCFPSTDSTECDKAMVWNWRDNTWAIRDLPESRHASWGIINDTTQGTYDTIEESYDETILRYNSRFYNPTAKRLLIAGTTDEKLYYGDTTNQHDGVNYTASVTKNGMLFDTPYMKHITRIFPNVSGTGSITVKLGSEDYPDEGPTYEEYEFEIGSSYKIDTRVSGRYISLQLESTNGNAWEAESFIFDYDTDGER